ncbi:MAG: AAA-like domain-containing protein [Chitinispirillales bacterium]|nr:AAA-like domain-containing protein [Chitinispirillales bacterium]
MQEWTEPERGIPAIVKGLASAIRDSGMPDGFAADADYSDATNVLRSSLVAYCRVLDKPLVIFFDESDCLSDGTLITFLRQLREGYVNRGDVPFVHSIALVGMRNIRDYKAQIRPESATLRTASPFNIVTKAFSLNNFSEAEAAELYAQHTAETGQEFEPQAVEYAFEQTQGQPWLVNAVARECVEELVKRDYSVPITQSMAEQAVQNIILARGTHFDSLLERLKEPRVRKVIQPLIMGEEVTDKGDDDYMFTKDLGLIRDDRDHTEPANPIYAELIFRALTRMAQESIKNAG